MAVMGTSSQWKSMKFVQFIDFIYEFYTRNVRNRYVVYGFILLVDSSYILFNNILVGRPPFQVAREVAALTIVLTITIPLLYFPLAKSTLIQSKQVLWLIFGILAFEMLIILGAVYSSAQKINNLVKNGMWPARITITSETPGRVSDAFQIRLVDKQENGGVGQVQVSIEVVYSDDSTERLEFNGLYNIQYIHIAEWHFRIKLMDVKNSKVSFEVSPVDS